jgi:hypothetical protein
MEKISMKRCPLHEKRNSRNLHGKEAVNSTLLPQEHHQIVGLRRKLVTIKDILEAANYIGHLTLASKHEHDPIKLHTANTHTKWRSPGHFYLDQSMTTCLGYSEGCLGYLGELAEPRVIGV